MSTAVTVPAYQGRTPGNSRKGQIPKTGFLSGCFRANFVRMAPGLTSVFKILSVSPDQDFFFSPRIVRIGYLAAQNRPGHTKRPREPQRTYKMGLEAVKMYFGNEQCHTCALIITHLPTSTRSLPASQVHLK
jgi:hypothetical protein